MRQQLVRRRLRFLSSPSIVLITSTVCLATTLPPPATDEQRRARQQVEDATVLFNDGEIMARAFRMRVQEAAELFSNDPAVQWALGAAKAGSAPVDVEAALGHYERARELAPGWKQPLYGMARIRTDQERWETALGLYNEGLDLPAIDEDDRRDDDEARAGFREIYRRRDGVVPSEEILDWRAEGPARGLDRLPLPRILFVHAKADLLPDAQAQLDELVRAMGDGRWTDRLIWFVGHASPDGWQGNDVLSETRAKAVRDYMRASVPGARIEVAWMGERDPWKGLDGRIDMDKSRRVELWHAAPQGWPPHPGRQKR